MYQSLGSVAPSDPSHLRSRSRSRTPSNSNPPSPTPESPMIPHSPLLRSASASSVAGESAFIAVAPPKPNPSIKLANSHSRTRSIDEHAPPERPHRALSSLSTPFKSPRPPISLGVPYVFRRRKKTVIAFLSTLFLLSIVRRWCAPTLLLLRFKLVDYAYSEGYGFPLAQRECGFRKDPIVFVKGQGQVSIVWEIGKCRLGRRDWSLRWRRRTVEARHSGAGAPRVHEWTSVEDLDAHELELDYDGRSLRTVYSTTIDSLTGGEMYDYEVLEQSVPVRRYSFPLLGPSSSSSSSPTTTTTTTSRSVSTLPQSIEIACVADNQFNLRTFDSILSRILSTSRSLASSFTSNPPGSNFSKRRRGRPHLLLHAGDHVQNPHDLAQWQTDFWDPVTYRLNGRRSGGGANAQFSDQVPILLARGNHDWDKTGRNVYVGGLSRRTEWDDHERNRTRDDDDDDVMNDEKKSKDKGRSTFYSFSPHERVRIVVLDSNLVTLDEQLEQERWLEWELSRPEWRLASLRLAVVHTAPWIEWWNARAWTDGKESQWSVFVRHRLVPILVRAKCTLLLSGHSHAYTRGFVPTSLVPALTDPASSRTSKSLLGGGGQKTGTGSGFAEARMRERAWEKVTRSRSTGVIDEPGLVSVTFGGAGGTLDLERVEDWAGMFQQQQQQQRPKKKKKKWGPRVPQEANYHFGHLTLHLAGSGNETQQPKMATTRTFTDPVRGLKGRNKRDWKNKGEWVYRAESWQDERECVERGGGGRRTWVEDWLEWRAIDIDGTVRDRIGIVGHACI